MCNMTYEVPYITAKMIFIPSQFHNCIHRQKDFTVNTQKMLILPSDFSPPPLSSSSQSTHPTGRITHPF